jgi:hypothetical protein
MKQYKLIKEYPGSPKLDTKIIKSNIYRKTGKEVIQSFMIKGEVWFKLDDPENYPEFWELVVEKDYEILSFDKGSIEIDKNGLWLSFRTNGTDTRIDENKMIERSHLIHSVKRL